MPDSVEVTNGEAEDSRVGSKSAEGYAEESKGRSSGSADAIAGGLDSAGASLGAGEFEARAAGDSGLESGEKIKGGVDGCGSSWISSNGDGNPEGAPNDGARDRGDGVANESEASRNPEEGCSNVDGVARTSWEENSSGFSGSGVWDCSGEPVGAFPTGSELIEGNICGSGETLSDRPKSSVTSGDFV